MSSKVSTVLPKHQSTRSRHISWLALFSALALMMGVGSAPIARAADLPLATTVTQACNPGDTQPMYRLYNRISREHLYTSAEKERDILTRGDWVYEGVGWVAPKKSTTPVYRLYNPHLGDHHYTPNATEVKALTSKHGWKAEGIAWYAAEEGWQRGAEPTYVRMAVTVADKDSLTSDTFTIPATAGIQYAVGGKKISAGTYKVKDYFKYTNYSATVTVTATAVKKGYRLKGATSWTKKVDGHTTATTKAVTFTDKDGLNNDTFTVPNVKGVQYKVNGKNIAAGTYKVKDYFKYTNYWANPEITATPKTGYKLKGATSWTKKIDGRIEVTPQTVSFTDKNGQTNDTFTVPNVKGVQYKAGSKNVAAGTHKVKDYFTYTNYMASATVTASPKAGYKFPSGATTSWKKTIDGYTTVNTVDPSGVDDYGKKSDTYTIPNATGIQYKADDINVAPGTHTVTSHGTNGKVTVAITATPKAGYKLKGTTSWNFNYTAIVTPQEVMFYDPYGSASDTVTIPDAEGVYYTIDGVRKTPGTYSVTTQIGSYSNHHREMSVHAYVDTGYTLKQGSQLYYFHKFTDGQQVTPLGGKRSTSDYGDYTVAQTKAKVEQFHSALTAKIEAGSDYASRTTIGDLFGVTKDTENPPITPTTLNDATREMNRRYALRYQERTNEFRAEFGLEPIALTNLTPEAEELAYAHAVATWNKYQETGGTGHYMDDPNILALKARNNNGQGLDFDGTYGVAENLYWQWGNNPSITPEEIADSAFAAYISEYPYLDGTFNHDNGHLVNLLDDSYIIHANYLYVAAFPRKVVGTSYSYSYTDGTWVSTPIYGTGIDLVSVQTPGAAHYR